MKILSIKFVEASELAIIYSIEYETRKWFKKVKETKNIILTRFKSNNISSFANLYESGKSFGSISMSIHVAEICKHDFKLNHPYK